MDKNTNYWFVGANWGGEDKAQTFIEQGYWENGYKDKYTELVNSIKPGEKIAIKSAYTQKHNLPFTNNGNTASVMTIKAIGTVISNHNNGRKVDVEWVTPFKEKKWFFYTSRSTIWRVSPNRWLSKSLIDFTFYNGEQDYNKFRNDPFWKERFGDREDKVSRFIWTQFYEEFASKLLTYKNDRKSLLQKLFEISEELGTINHLNDKDSNGNPFPLEDICPFTVFGCFNRGLTPENRMDIAHRLAELLDVKTRVPESFESIPILNNQKSWFFARSFNRGKKDIDLLWDLFEKGIKYADEDDGFSAENFKKSYDLATEIKNVGWNITMGLYWIRPWDYLPLDGTTRTYLKDKFNIIVDKNGPKNRCNADDYLKTLNIVESRLKEPNFPVHSFPELSLEAWRYEPPSLGGTSAGTWKRRIYDLIKAYCKENNANQIIRKDFHDRYISMLEEFSPNNSSIKQTVDRVMQELRNDEVLSFIKPGVYEWNEFEDFTEPDDDYDYADQLEEKKKYEPYDISSIIEDGCFFEREEIESILNSLERKKNIVLQGPPGVGKSWLGKKIAFALIGEKDEQKVQTVQFHPNFSYEDFIRGWRPTSSEGLELQDGPFLEMVYLAQKNPDSKFVMVIEEINRGNPSQIFGEVLTLIENDKRTPNEAINLTYGNELNKKVYIPENMYVIGTMNIADRSLALVDLALRRRFSFINLSPKFDRVWQEFLSKEFSFPQNLVNQIAHKVENLNQSISSEPLLGKQFAIGHSYFTPSTSQEIEDHKKWFEEIVHTEIFPLLQEYFFDNPKKADELRKEMLKDW